MKKYLINLGLIFLVLQVSSQVNLGVGFGLQSYFSNDLEHSSFPSKVAPQIDLEVGYPIKDSSLRLMSGISFYNRANNIKTSSYDVWLNESLLSIPLMLYFDYDVKSSAFAQGFGLYASMPYKQKHYASDASLLPTDYKTDYRFPYTKFGLVAEFLFFVQRSSSYSTAIGAKATFEHKNLSLNKNQNPDFYHNSFVLRVLVTR